MPNTFTESVVEDAALSWPDELGCAVAHGPAIAPEELAAARASFAETVLAERLRVTLRKLNPTLPTDATDEAFRKAAVPQRIFHTLFSSTLGRACSYLSPNHAISCSPNVACSFPSFLSKIIRHPRWRRAVPGWGGRSALGRNEGAAHGLCGHVQFSTSRRAADSGRFAAGQWPGHSPFSSRSPERGDDTRRPF